MAININRDEITQLTEKYGGNWGIKHAKRLLHMVPVLADGREYDEEAIWLAAYLHDWGGYAAWAKPGMEHYDRSAEVARDFLAERGCPDDLKALVSSASRFTTAAIRTGASSLYCLPTPTRSICSGSSARRGRLR